MISNLPFAARIGGSGFEHFEIYKFSHIQELQRRERRLHPHRKPLDFSIGRPRETPSPAAIEEMRTSAAIGGNHFYADCGCMSFMEAASHYMDRVFDVSVEPEVELLPSMGSKNALTYAALAHLNPGDVLLTTVPGYPILPNFARYLGAEIFPLPLHEKNGYFPDLTAIPASVLCRAKMLHLNYPNNPTGACASLEFFREAVEFCRKNFLILLHDAAYAGLWDENCPPRSALQVPGAMDLTLELHSCSKAHAMTGWRIGWVCGQRKLVAAYRRIKENCDSGQFLPIQHGAAVALADDAHCRGAMGRMRRRMEAVESVLALKGFSFAKNHHPFYSYTRAPVRAGEVTFSSGEDFCAWLMEVHGIFTVPWDEVDRRIRFAMTIPLEPEELTMQLRDRLDQISFSF
ncbi:MAG: aminotransferase class I/II-fold pyridoxal phosphate-dependent enzyme [Puniceicoccales bacterium]|jgi:LL-diaminopimelate aminotransferase|nr:aminotransferase class I/II-fold pyridoxal phosphate-dependent enzyme [Puniceicoccales bacterium]